MANTREDVYKAISQREDVNPKEGVDKYGKVEFADAKNHKYPIDTAEHIRAAWNYINKRVNDGKYTDAEVEQIKNKIIAAWKKKIDKAGPPSAGKSTDEDLFPNNALKAISENDNELVVRNHIILFGGRDLTGIEATRQGFKVVSVNGDGTRGEYFSKNTNFESEFTKTGTLDVDFEHGFDPDKTGNDPNEILGYVDWKTAKITDDGVIVDRVLNRRARYVKALETLIKEGLIGTSSACIPGTGKKTTAGEIIKWPLMRDTLTVSPAEPRMLSDNALSAVKSLAVEIPYFKSLLSAIPASEAALPIVADPIQTKPKEDNMPEPDVKSIVDSAVAAALKARDETAQIEADKQTAMKAAEEAGYKKAIEDLEAKHLIKKAPSYIKKLDSDSDEGMGAFKSWLGNGEHNSELITPDMKPAWAKAAFNITTGASGSYLVPDPLYQVIQAKRNLMSWARQAPVQVFSTPADHILVPVEDTSMTAFVQTGEGVAYDENEPTVAQKDLILYKYTKLVKANEEFLAFQGTNFDAWIARAFGRAEAVTENTILTTGTGSGAPLGVNTATGATTGNVVTTSAVLVPQDLSALIGQLGAGYNVMGETGFLMKNATKWYLRGLTTTGFFAFVNQNSAGSGPNTYPGGQMADGFFGYPAYIDDDMDAYTVAASSGHSIVYGNWNYYGIVEKPGLLIQRNPYLYMANGQIGLFATMYRGGATLQQEAFYRLVGK